MNERFIRCLPLVAIVVLILPARVFAIAAPTVVSWDVLFGTQSYNLGVNPLGLTDLPWEITGVQVLFSQPIVTADVDSLSGVVPTSLSGLGTNTLTWNFPVLPDGHYSTLLDGTGPNAIEGAGDNALSGGSGFAQDFSVLIGDVNGDGKVNSADVAGVIAGEAEPYNIVFDINGDGVVDGTDASLVEENESSTTVPEPATIALLALGFVGLAVSRRKTKTGR